ncbi:MAG: alpha-galactosidase [Planctomycetota bacterium]|jgi:hypothetical protein
MRRIHVLALATAASVAATATPTAWATEFPGAPPGKAAARLEDGTLVLENNVLSVTWSLADGLFVTETADRISRRSTTSQGNDAFVIELGDGRSLEASQMASAGEPSLERVEADPKSLRRAGRFAGWKAAVPLVSPDGALRATWSAVLRDQSSYVRQKLVVRAEAAEVAVKGVGFLHFGAPAPAVAGVVEGSPVVAGNLFFAFEHPMAVNRVEDGRVACSGKCYGRLEAGEAWECGAVIGVVPPGQLRRGFLYYLERERARPYGLFLHYNSWWDIAWGDRLMNEEQCLEVIEIFGRELTGRRGVTMDSFVFDDGWDDPKTLWGFHDGFPRGFAPLAEAAAKHDSAVGTWFSPWGGYGQRKAQRLEYGKTQGFETNTRGFSLAGPKYYARYREICTGMIEKYGVNYFKFDGIARGVGSEGAGDDFAPDVDALLRLTGELRRQNPEVYLSITTGTWPSPYWLFYGDSVWRNGHDWAAHGAGTVRQQWITYRDMLTYRMIVRRAPLYPINSLMTVTVCFAQLGTATRMTDDVDDLVDEIRMAFGSGTQLAELYVTPQMMKPRAWDVLAESAKWSRENGDVLVDVHWIGGDPGEGEPYGYASWSPRKGILVLRNPSEAPAEMTLTLADALELPSGSPATYALDSRWSPPDRPLKLRLTVDQAHTFELAPFEVLILEATPVE